MHPAFLRQDHSYILSWLECCCLRIRQGPFLSGQLQPWDSILQLQQQNLIGAPKPGWTQPIRNQNTRAAIAIHSPILSQCHNPMASKRRKGLQAGTPHFAHGGLTASGGPSSQFTKSPRSHSSACNARLCPGMPPTAWCHMGVMWAPQW